LLDQRIDEPDLLVEKLSWSLVSAKPKEKNPVFWDTGPSVENRVPMTFKLHFLKSF
jgi:hypothetical protein